MSFLQKIYKWSRDETWLAYYSKYKDWLRVSTLGRVLDRFLRIFVISTVVVFLTNYSVGGEFLPVLKSSLTAGLVACFDKIKNEWLKTTRDPGYTQL